MQDRQTGGLKSFWRNLRAVVRTPDPVISPDAPLCVDAESPGADRYPFCHGAIPLDHSEADLVGRSPSFDGPKMH